MAQKGDRRVCEEIRDHRVLLLFLFFFFFFLFLYTFWCGSMIPIVEFSKDKEAVSLFSRKESWRRNTKNFGTRWSTGLHDSTDLVFVILDETVRLHHDNDPPQSCPSASPKTYLTLSRQLENNSLWECKNISWNPCRMTRYVGSCWARHSGEILQVSFKDSQITENGAAEEELGREGETENTSRSC